MFRSKDLAKDAAAAISSQHEMLMAMQAVVESLCEQVRRLQGFDQNLLESIESLHGMVASIQDFNKTFMNNDLMFRLLVNFLISSGTVHRDDLVAYLNDTQRAFSARSVQRYLLNPER